MTEIISNGFGLVKILQAGNEEIDISEKDMSLQFQETFLLITKQRVKISSVYDKKIRNAETIQKFFLKNNKVSRYVCMLINTTNEFVCVVYIWEDENQDLPGIKIYSNVLTEPENHFDEIILKPASVNTTMLDNLY